MADIMDYIDWRGDIGFDEVHVNEVDGLIFSQLIYVRMKPYMPDAKKSYLTIKQLSSLYCADHSDDEIEQMPNLFRHSARLLQKLAHSRRYADCILRYYIYDISEKEESQFSAVTIELPDGTYFISYSGTDHSVVGWKENFNLSYLDETPGQNKAKKYLKQVAAYICNDENINNKSISARRLWIGGHSKGGNLAVFAAMHVDKEVQDVIIKVFNFDGPGFNEATISSEEFGKVDMRIRTFVPQSSMIGILMWHREPFTIVRSNGVGVFQHDAYTWQIMGGDFIKLSERTGHSHFADDTIKRWLEELKPDMRRQAIDGIYAVLSASNGMNVSDLFEARNTMSVLKAAGAMDEKTRSAVLEAFRLLGSSMIGGVPGWLERTASSVAQKMPWEQRKEEAKALAAQNPPELAK